MGKPRLFRSLSVRIIKVSKSIFCSSKRGRYSPSDQAVRKRSKGPLGFSSSLDSGSRNKQERTQNVDFFRATYPTIHHLSTVCSSWLRNFLPNLWSSLHLSLPRRRSRGRCWLCFSWNKMTKFGLKVVDLCTWWPDSRFPEWQKYCQVLDGSSLRCCPVLAWNPVGRWIWLNR